jgi:hypothetical protein
MKAMRVSSFANDNRGEFTAHWMLLTDNAGFFALPEVAAQARQPTENPRVRLWTDDYSSLLPIIRW